MEGSKPNPLPVCFLCLKRFNCCSQTTDDGANAADSNNKFKFSSNKFMVFTHSHLDIPVKKFPHDIKNSSCQECRDFMGSICHLYDQLCSIHLQLSRELDQLADLLDYSKKRVSDKMIKVVMTSLAGQLSQEDEEDGESVSLEQVDKMRVLLAQKCRLYSQARSKVKTFCSPSNQSAQSQKQVSDDDDDENVSEISAGGDGDCDSVAIKKETANVNGDDDDLQTDNLDNHLLGNNEEPSLSVSRPRRRVINIVLTRSRDKMTVTDSDTNGNEGSAPDDEEYAPSMDGSENNSSDSEQEAAVKRSTNKRPSSSSSSRKAGLRTCDQCQKKYRNQGALIKHKLLKHGEKKGKEVEGLFSCDQCDAKFTTKWVVPLHKQKMHNAPRPPPSVKPYGCDKCSVRFKHRFSIHSHMKVVHGVTSFSILGKDKPYKCEICGRGSTSEYGLTRHKMTVHGIIQEDKRRRGRKSSRKTS